MTREDTDLVKGLAIAMMLWHHLFLNTLEYGKFVNDLAVFFKVCVSLFLFVSGYGLTKQYARIERHTVKNTAIFLSKRYVKFFMSYWFCMALVLAVGLLSGYSLHEAYPATRNVWKCLILDIWGQMGYSSYLPTWWFNKLIIQLYLIFPLLFLLLRNKYVSWIGLLALIAVEQTSCVNVFCVIEGGVVAFYIGMLAARHSFRIPNRGLALLLGLAAIAALAFVRCRLKAVRFTIVDGFLAWVFSLALVQGKTYYRFPVLHVFGKYATVIYLIHILIKRLLATILYAIPYAVLTYVSFMAVSLLVAVVIVKLQEWCRYDRLQAKVVGYLSKPLSK